MMINQFMVLEELTMKICHYFRLIFLNLKIHLEQNYRSSQAILDISNKLISVNQNREEKKLFSEREGHKSDVVLKQLDDEKMKQVMLLV